eukprot:Clim_evm7s14 gene=Clim_evmTU7s14
MLSVLRLRCARLQNPLLSVGQTSLKKNVSLGTNGNGNFTQVRFKRYARRVDGFVPRRPPADKGQGTFIDKESGFGRIRHSAAVRNRRLRERAKHQQNTQIPLSRGEQVTQAETRQLLGQAYETMAKVDVLKREPKPWVPLARRRQWHSQHVSRTMNFEGIKAQNLSMKLARLKIAKEQGITKLTHEQWKDLSERKVMETAAEILPTLRTSSPGTPFPHLNRFKEARVAFIASQRVAPKGLAVIGEASQHAKTFLAALSRDVNAPISHRMVSGTTPLAAPKKRVQRKITASTLKEVTQATQTQRPASPAEAMAKAPSAMAGTTSAVSEAARRTVPAARPAREQIIREAKQIHDQSVKVAEQTMSGAMQDVFRDIARTFQDKRTLVVIGVGLTGLGIYYAALRAGEQAPEDMSARILQPLGDVEAVVDLEKQLATSLDVDAIVKLSDFDPVQEFRRIGVIRTLGRMIVLYIKFLPNLITLPLFYLIPTSVSWKKDFVDWWWNQLFHAVESAGPAFIKFGQWASTRKDIFSEDFCCRFSKLHSASRTHSLKETLSILRYYLGDNITDTVAYIEQEPIGSGAIAQVHKARIYDPVSGTTQDVALKVIHPGVRDSILLDLALAHAFARILDYSSRARWMSVRESVEQFTGVMIDQLDMRREAFNLVQFNKNFKDDRDRYIFPVPVPNMIEKDYLMESYEPGTPISEYMLDNNSEKNALGHQLACLGLDAFLKMLLVDNFIHGDLHPGNILVRETDEENSGPKLVFLDTGIITELSPGNRKNFRDLFEALTSGRGRDVGLMMVERARGHECENPEEFADKVGELVDNVRSRTLSLGKVSVGEVLGNILTYVADYHVKIEPDFASVVMAVGVVEGVGRSLDPEVDIFERAVPILKVSPDFSRTSYLRAYTLSKYRSLVGKYHRELGHAESVEAKIEAGGSAAASIA